MKSLNYNSSKTISYHIINKLLILFLLVGTNLNLKAQSCDRYQNSIDTVCINLFFHIVRDVNSSGGEGFNPMDLDIIIENMNSVYNPHGIYLNKTGYDYIDEYPQYYDLNTNIEFNALLNLRDTPNSIDFFLVNSYGSNNGYAESHLSKKLVVVNESAYGSVPAHEVGHCLNLYHIDWGRNLEANSCLENTINGCDCGDQVRDTPPCPSLTLLSTANNNCQYTGPSTYNPDLTNIMAYNVDVGNNCRDHFTPGQAERMKYYIETEPILQQVVGASCLIPYIMGNEEICDDEELTYTLVNDVAINGWEVSDNLREITSTPTSITVERFNSSSFGEGTITANLEDYSIEKRVWVGRLPYLTQASLNTGDLLIYGYPNNVCLNKSISTDITFNGADSVSWTLVSSSHNTTWSQQDNNVSFYLWATNHTATFKLKASNECGDFSRLYKFIGKKCPKGGGDPCDIKFSLAKNPVDTNIEILRIPAPCELKNTDSADLSKIELEATLFDLSGNKIKSNKHFTGKMNIESLKPGLYILILTSTNGNLTNYHVLKK